MERKKLEECKRALILVDVVKGFIVEGKLSDPFIKRIIPRCVKLVEDYISTGDPIFNFMDAHTKDSAELKRYPEHCLIGTRESELVDELKPYEYYMITLLKNSTSGFVVKGFKEYLDRMILLERLEAAGCCQDICVPNLLIPTKNYYDENNRDVEIVTSLDNIETYDAPWHNREEWNNMSIKMMRQAGIKVLEKGVRL